MNISRFYKRLLLFLISNFLFFIIGYIYIYEFIEIIVWIFYPEVYEVLPSKDIIDELGKSYSLDSVGFETDSVSIIR